MNFIVQSTHCKFGRNSVDDTEPLWTREQQNSCLLRKFLKYVGAVRREDHLDSTLPGKPKQKPDKATLSTRMQRGFNLVDEQQRIFWQPLKSPKQIKRRILTGALVKLGEFAPLTFEQPDRPLFVDIRCCEPRFRVVATKNVGESLAKRIADLGTLNFRRG